VNCKQLRANVAYVAYCMKLLRDSPGSYEAAAVCVPFDNWLDFLEGRTYAPEAGEVWSDVQQPKRRHHG